MPKKKEEVAEEVVETTTSAPEEDLVVNDPEVILPKELPLIIEEPKAGWKNEAQVAFAKVLNGYAYKNPAKWAIKKEVLIGQLKELGKNPERLAEFQGTQTAGIKGKVDFQNQSAPVTVDK